MSLLRAELRVVAVESVSVTADEIGAEQDLSAEYLVFGHPSLEAQSSLARWLQRRGR